MSICQEQSRLIQMWKEAADDLGLEITVPFDLTLGSGVKLHIPLLLRHFGGEEGMLVLSDYNTVKSISDELVQAGYGFSVLDEPRSEEKYVRQDYIDILIDWGWFGDQTEKPDWLE